MAKELSSKRRAINTLMRRQKEEEATKIPEGKGDFNVDPRLRSSISYLGSLKDLEMSFEDFKKHIEAEWDHGMSWNNYGNGGWVLRLLDASKSARWDNFVSVWKSYTHKK